MEECVFLFLHGVMNQKAGNESGFPMIRNQKHWRTASLVYLIAFVNCEARRPYPYLISSTPQSMQSNGFFMQCIFWSRADHIEVSNCVNLGIAGETEGVRIIGKYIIQEHFFTFVSPCESVLRAYFQRSKASTNDCWAQCIGKIGLIAYCSVSLISYMEKRVKTMHVFYHKYTLVFISDWVIQKTFLIEISILHAFYL